MWWAVGAAANALIALAFLAIAWAIARPLRAEGLFRTNKLGTATALIFLTSGVHHGVGVLMMLAPSAGIDSPAGVALREAFLWPMGAWDVLGAGLGIYYWSLRRTYGAMMPGAMRDELKEKQRTAIELNDNIVQGLAVAHMALEMDDRERSRAALESTLASARTIISNLLGETGSEIRLGPGDLVRTAPAHLKDAANE